MNIKNFQDILPLVERPSRYLGTEINTIKKDIDKVRLKIALAFPDLYEIGTSHFGLQILYHILNKHDDIAAERVYAPDVDMESYLRSSHLPLVSLESHHPLKKFDIIGFSLLYELNYTNILTMLDLAGIPFYSSKRDDSFPIIIAGGPCTCNPEPVADFFDAMVVGDGENVIMDISRTWLEWKKGNNTDKESLLKQLSLIKGLYIPAFFNSSSGTGDKNFFQIPQPMFSNYKVINKEIITDIDTAPFPDAPIIPFGRPVHDRLRMEIARGCTRGCRFCQAGMIYRPVRERSVERLLNLTDASLSATGYEDISLLSLSSADYGNIVPLMEQLMSRYKSGHVAVSLPSLRAGTLTPELINLIKRVRKTGFTIAPEAGSQSLRDFINKNITEKEIVDTVQDVFDMGWLVIKLYFMIGLPSETDDDLQAIVSLVKKLRKIKAKGRHSHQINVSVATFIPKPHTPFQWAPQLSLDESRGKIEKLRAELKMSGIRFKWQNPQVSILEGVFARGDRQLSALLVDAYEKGCRFDGWSEKFQYKLWQQALLDQRIDVNHYTGARALSDSLPWDHIDAGVTKEFLKKELGKAEKGESTQDCRTGECNNCGVCDFDTIKPAVFEVDRRKTVQDVVSFLDNKKDLKDNPVEFFPKIKVGFSKKGKAKYFGHLELVNIFLRALRRAGIPVKFTEGYHPKPRISFGDTLPLGMESLNESLYLVMCGNVKTDHVKDGLNNNLPEGLFVSDCQQCLTKADVETPKSALYFIELKDSCFDNNAINNFINRPSLIQTSVNRKGKVKKVDLKDMVLKIDLRSPCNLILKLRSEPGRTARPFDILKTVFSFSEDTIRQATVIKQ